MKINKAVDIINKTNIKQIYGSKNYNNRTGKYNHVVIWEEDKEWIGINKLKQIEIRRQTTKPKTRSITFSFVVGPNISFVERINEYQNGNVSCNFAFRINKLYDKKKHGSSHIRIDLQNLRGRKPSC